MGEDFKMKDVVNRVNEMLLSNNLSFLEKPILIGGMAMEYYEISIGRIWIY